MKEVDKVDSLWPTLDSLTLISWQADLHFDGQLRRRLDVAPDLIEPEKEEDSFQFRAKLSFFRSDSIAPTAQGPSYFTLLFVAGR